MDHIFVFGLIQAGIFLIPVIALGYKQGKKDQQIINIQSQIEKMKADMNGAESKIGMMQSSWDDGIKNLSDKVSKIEIEIGKIVTVLEFLRQPQNNGD